MNLNRFKQMIGNVARSTHFEVILNIIDDDKDKTDWIPREIIYNFPQGLSEDEIELVSPKVTARFKLVPINPDDS